MKIRFQGQLDWIQWDAISTGTNLYKTSDFPEKNIGKLFAIYSPFSSFSWSVIQHSYDIPIDAFIELG